MYRQGKNLHKILADEADRMQKSVIADFGRSLEVIKSLLDSQYEIVDHTVWLLGQQHLSGRNDTEAAVFSAIHKNFFLFYSAVTLTKSGLYGPAGTLLRPIFESLYIAKYCSLSSNDLTFKRWKEGEYVHVTNEVFNEIKSSPLPESRILWKTLNQLSHATVYAQQVSARYEEIKDEIGICFSLVEILAILNHHLISRHYLTPQVIRYTRIYGKTNEFEVARVRARQVAAAIRSEFTKDAKRVVREYIAAWEIK